MRKWRNRPGFGSEQEIDLWSSDAKLKARLHEQRLASGTRPQRASSKPNEEERAASGQEERRVPNTSLNRLRERTREERSNCSLLGNRMDYMEEELRRKRQLVEQARGRYQRVLEVRCKSVAEKKELAKVILPARRSGSRS